MKSFIVRYRRKGKGPTPSGVMSVQRIDSESEEGVYTTLYERLHVTKEIFDSKYEIIEIIEE